MRKAIAILYVLVMATIGWVCYLCYADFYYTPNNAAALYIAVLGTLITFVVAWQIWCTIDAKNALREITAIRDSYQKLITSETTRVGEYNMGVTYIIDALMSFQETHYLIHHSISPSRGKNSIGYNRTYTTALRGLRNILKYDLPQKELNLVGLCLDNMEASIEAAENVRHQYEALATFDKERNAICDGLMREIDSMPSQSLTNSQRRQLDGLEYRRKMLIAG